MGSPIAAAWFAHRNLSELGQRRSARKVLKIGLALTIALLALALVLPDNFPNIILPLAYSSTIYYVAKNRFEVSVAKHLASGGKLGSWWLVAGVSILFLLGVFAVLSLTIWGLPLISSQFPK